ncbi:hypothetical protein JX265_009435 [Neoarthrinium moseri]|uniref:Coenzyme Q-binding protein COQ10 START domain-containing protein n=1 Tax=Neoarthrinium moseri TaxID=1658444 RepID=A0A9P9WGJ0_9PEZI|nr:hypothetical protein JX266_012003 [Neoarthrinium moseri]KAI1861932.1 hypothetical protein JX265_009435 [Neoarthrinium moseri]
MALSSTASPFAGWANLRCPQHPSGILTTPTYGEASAVFTVCTETVISSNVSSVYNAIIDFNRYSAWNSFVYRVDLPPTVQTPDQVYVGMPMTLHTTGLVPLLNTTSAEEITVLDLPTTEGYSMIAWKYIDGLDGLGSRAEHPNILVPRDDGATRYLSYETYYNGLEIGVMVALRASLQFQFEQQGQDLKDYVETRGNKS